MHSRWNLAVRVALAAAAAWGCGVLGSFSERGQFDSMWCGAMLVLVGMTMVLLWTIRGAATLLASRRTSRKPWSAASQFTIWGMLSLMTGCALLLAFRDQFHIPLENALSVAGVCLALQAVPVVAWLMTLLPWPKTLLAIPATALAMAAESVFLAWFRSLDLEDFLWCVGAQATCVTSCLATARLLGCLSCLSIPACATDAADPAR